MAYAIMRFAKLKTWGNVGGVAGHHTRDRATPNADPRQPNRWLAGPHRPAAQDIVAAVRARIGDRTVRKNAVLGLEFFLGASPEYFRPDDPGRPGHYDPARLEAFNKVALDWLRRTFGRENVVSAVCHLDESTPHVQAVVVPIDPATGRLNASRWINGKKCLAELQDGFALACWSLGLDRGIRGSKATHSRVAEFYAAVNAADATPIPTVQVQSPPAAMIRETAREQWAADESRRINDGLQPAFQPIADTAAAARLARAKQDQAEATARAVTGELERVRRESDMVRDTPLADVLERSGYARDGQGLWSGPAGHISIGVKNGKARFRNDALEVGGTGAIDLVMHLHGLDFRDAVTWLSRKVDRAAAIGAAMAYAREVAKEAVKSAAPLPLKDWDAGREARAAVQDAQDMVPGARLDAPHPRPR